MLLAVASLSGFGGDEHGEDITFTTVNERRVEGGIGCLDGRGDTNATTAHAPMGLVLAVGRSSPLSAPPLATVRSGTVCPRALEPLGCLPRFSLPIACSAGRRGIRLHQCQLQMAAPSPPRGHSHLKSTLPLVWPHHPRDVTAGEEQIVALPLADIVVISGLGLVRWCTSSN